MTERKEQRSEAAPLCPECEGSGNVDGGICAVCRGVGVRLDPLGEALFASQEWEHLCGELRARESVMSGILCDLADVPSDPVEGLRVLAEYWRRQRPAESTPVIGECEACDDFHWCFPGGRRRESPKPWARCRWRNAGGGVNERCSLTEGHREACKFVDDSGDRSTPKAGEESQEKSR